MEGQPGRWGGELRRARVFRTLAERTGAMVIEGFAPSAVQRGLAPRSYVPLPLPRLGGGRLPRLAAADPLRPDVLWALARHADPTVLAYYDDPIAQTRALGIRLPWLRERMLHAKRSANLRAFRWYVVPSASFAELVALEASRVIVAGNGTDAGLIRPGPWPEVPTIGMVSGAAPARGIEALIAAARLVRQEIAELRLRLWLVATGRASAQYLDELRRRIGQDTWVQVESASHAQLGDALGQATVLCIPHPPSDYMDVALPVKLYDSMAAGRPVVVTPRTETRVIIERHGAGIVAAGDSVDDLAAALAAPLRDAGLARQLGAAARSAAEREYDWTIVGDRLASEILEREGGR